MRRKEHDEIIMQNYRHTRRRKSNLKGKSLHKRKKSRRPSSKILLKSALRNFMGNN